MLSSRLFTQRLRQQTLRQCFQFPLSHVVCDRKSLHHSASILSSSSNVNTLDTNDKSEGVGSSSSRNNQGFECVYDELEARGFIQQTTNQVELRKCLKESISVYAGFDPTADSLHVGNLVVLMTLLHFQRYGHRPICLVGGATGMIGDPSGRNSERNMMQQDTLDRNLEGIKRSLAQILTFEDGSTLSSPPSSSARLPSPGSPATLVNNLDWYKDMNILDFLRDYGQHFRLGQMLNKDSVTSRLNSEAGMSFLEFSYSTLQSTDFLTLYRSHACRLQIGGSDQWGNIVLGTDLVKKSTQGEREGEKATEGEGEVEGEVEGDKVFGLTVPLLATSTGEKFGKSAGNALWLDESKTSPYQLYQYFFNADDADVERFLKLFTLLPLTEIDSIVQTHQGSLHERTGQQALATQVVHLIHGEVCVCLCLSLRSLDGAGVYV